MNKIQKLPLASVGATELAANWLNSQSDATMAVYRASITAMAKAFGMSLDDMVTHIISDKTKASLAVLQWRTMMEKGKKLSPSTISLRLRSVRALISFANETGAINWDVKIRVKKPESADRSGPGVEGIQTMLKYAAAQPNAKKALRDVAMLRVFFSCGLRRAELASLDKMHFDPERGLNVMRKGAKARVWVPVPKETATAKALTAWAENIESPDDPLFPGLRYTGQFCGRLTGRGLGYIINELGRLALGKRVRCHGLRHTAITAALDAFNGDLRRVARFSGHKSLEMLMRYDDARDNSAGEVSAKLDDMVK